MPRSIAYVIVGAVLGGVGMYLALPEHDGSLGPDAASPSILTAIAGIWQRDDSVGDTPSVADRREIYRAVAATELASLESRLDGLAGMPGSVARDLEIEAVLARLADLAPERAAALALAAGLEPAYLARAFGYWAEVDADAAIAALDRIGDPFTRQTVALGLLERLGDSAASVDRVAAALPAADERALRAGWLERRAAYDPYGAFTDALALADIDQQRLAIQTIGEVWAEQDPLGALLQADQLRDGRLQSIYRSAVSSRWARLDPQGFLAYLQSGSADADELQGGFQWLAASDADALLDVALGVGGSAGRNLRLIALYELAALDPDAALARAEAMPVGQEREMMLSQVAARYAETDPRAALAWARELEPPATNILNTVVQSIVRSDPELAVELIADPPPGVNTQLIAAMVGSLGMQDSGQTARMAGLLLGRDDALSRATLSGMVSNWIRRDEEAALDWMTQNLAGLDAQTVGQAAQAMARRDPAGAAAYVNRIPQAHRDAWITQIAAPYAAYDPAGAASWIAQYQGSPVYEPAYRQMIMQVAQTDPDAASRMLNQASAEVQFGAAGQVASALARRDPRAAARWATGLADPRARASAVETAVTIWSASDRSAARNWIVDQPRGEARDRALAALVPQFASAGDFDSDLLGQIDSTQARSEALIAAIPNLARTDPGQARDIFDSDLVSGADRRLIEQRMSQFGISF